MATLIIILFLWLLLGFALYRILSRRSYAFSLPQVLLFYGAKIAAGTGYGYIFQRWYKGDDTWGLHHDSLLQYHRLLKTPGLFFSDIFSSMPVPATGEYYFQSEHYSENLEYCITGKVLGLCNCLSGGQYYINVVLLNFFGFLGMYLFYRLIAPHIRAGAHKWVAALLFMFPPVVFWLSGIRTECFLLIAVAALLHYFNKWLQTKKWQALVTALVAGSMVLLLRNGFLLMLIPSLLAWAIAVRLGIPVRRSLLYVAGACLLLLFASAFLPAGINPLNKLAERQQTFFQLKGNTRFNLSVLEPTPQSLLRVIPEAFLNTFLRPFPWEARGALQYFSSGENLAVVSLLIASLGMYIRKKKAISGLGLALLLSTAALCNYILIGCIVPFPGAIVRYKIIGELFLLAVSALLAFGEDQRTTASSQI